MGKNAEAVKRGIELFNKGNIPGLLELYDLGAQVESQGTIIGGSFRGREGLQEWFQKIGNVYRGGVQLKIDNLYEAGDAVIVEWTGTGKLANGEAIAAKTLSVLEFRGDKVVNHRLYSDTEQLARAMGKL